MEEKEIRNRIKEIESELKFYKEELDKITLAKEFAELRGIYELFKKDTFIKVENSNKVERYGVPVIIYHIKDKQELKLNTALHRYSFRAHFDSSIVFDRESKVFSITNYTEGRFLEYESSPILRKDDFSVLQTYEVEQLINKLTKVFLQR